MSDHSSDLPVLTNLNETMRCGILTNSNGDILILHDMPLNGFVDYIEYDQQEDTFTLIFEDGKMQNIGIDFDRKMASDLSHGLQVTLGYFLDKKIESSQTVTFLVRDK